MKAVSIVVGAVLALIAVAIGLALVNSNKAPSGAPPPTTAARKPQEQKKNLSSSTAAASQKAKAQQQPPACRAALMAWRSPSSGKVNEALTLFSQNAIVGGSNVVAVNTFVCPELEFVGREPAKIFTALEAGEIKAPLNPALESSFSAMYEMVVTAGGSASPFPPGIWGAATKLVSSAQNAKEQLWTCLIFAGVLEGAKNRATSLDPVMISALEACILDVQLPLHPFSQMTHAAVTLVAYQIQVAQEQHSAKTTPEQEDLYLEKLAQIRMLWFAAKLPRYGGHYTSAVEKTLTQARRMLLDRAVVSLEEQKEAPSSSLAVTSKNHHLHHYLASQIAAVCFENEYIFAVDDENGKEEEKVAQLQADLAPLLSVLDFPIEIEGLGYYLNGVAVASSTVLAILASYRPLNRLPFAEELFTVYKQFAEEHQATPTTDDIPDYILLLKQQIAEPFVEREIQKKMLHDESSTLDSKKSDDTISKMISDMYEENPYPRWHSPWDCVPGSNVCGHPKWTPSYAQQLERLARVVDGDVVATKPAEETAVHFPKPDGTGAPTQLLFAGCGTGRQIALTSSVEPQTRITAFDLSTASLAYGSRQWHTFHGKSMRNGRTAPVTFARRNIMTVSSESLASSFPQANGGFDLIEVTGVLMILSDPDAGLANLVKLLRPGGLIKIAVYSTAARAHHGVYAGRAKIAEAQRARGLKGDLVSCNQTGILCNSSLSEIQKGRQIIIDVADATLLDSTPQTTEDTGSGSHRLDNERASRLVDGDFHSASDCRDLLFHPHERAYNLQELDTMITKAGLQFYGFDVAAKTQAALKDVLAEDKKKNGGGAATAQSRPWWWYWSMLEDQDPSVFAEMYQFWAIKPQK